MFEKGRRQRNWITEAFADSIGVAALVTPTKIRTLQRKLYTRAKQEPGDHIVADNLACSNKGASRIDGVSFSAIEAEERVEQFLAGLASDSLLEEGACLGMKNIGKPCMGKPYAWFD